MPAILPNILPRVAQEKQMQDRCIKVKGSAWGITALQEYLEMTLEIISITVALCCMKDDANWTVPKLRICYSGSQYMWLILTKQQELEYDIPIGKLSSLSPVHAGILFEWAMATCHLELYQLVTVGIAWQ